MQSRPIAVMPDGCKGVVVHGSGETLDELVAACDDSKLLFGVAKASLSGAGAFKRYYSAFVCFRGPSLGTVKAAKLMARNAAVKGWCSDHSKSIVAAVTSEEKETLKDTILLQIKNNTINEKDDVEYEKGKGDENTPADVADCAMFVVDMANDKFGMCICGFPKMQHTPEAIAASQDAAKRRVSMPNAGYRASVDAAADMAAAPTEAMAVKKSHWLTARKVMDMVHFQLMLMKSCAVEGKDGTEWQKMKTPKPTGAEALAIVRNARGTPLNWVLFKPSKDTLEVEDAGGGGVPELSGILEKNHNDKLLYGMVRVAFGTGKMRRSWHFSIQWTGTGFSGVKAAQTKAACKGPMEGMMGNVSFRMDATEPNDVMPDEVIKKLVTTCITDGNVDDLSVQALIDALEEEEEAIREFHAGEEEAAKKARAEEAEKAKIAIEKAEEEERERKAEAARLAKLAEEEVMMTKAKTEGSVTDGLHGLRDKDAEGWILFEIVV